MSYSSSESCSPAKPGSGGAHASRIQTCFSYQSLAKIARRHNEANPQNPIPISRSRDELWTAIKSRMPQCHNERCWTTVKWLPSKDRESLVEEFKPPLPKGANVWLNTDDIDHVIDRYERIFPDFRFMGTFPIDFRVYERGAMQDLRRWLKSSHVKSIGMVLNLDEHDEPGSHWVAVFVDKPNRTVEYFDSFADETPDEVLQFFEDVKRSAPHARWTLKENNVAHQRGNTECGVYSIHFIVKRLTGASFSQVIHDIVRDDRMNKNRKVFFDPHNVYDSE